MQKVTKSPNISPHHERFRHAIADNIRTSLTCHASLSPEARLNFRNQNNLCIHHII
jgi:hypothetical protein